MSSVCFRSRLTTVINLPALQRTAYYPKITNFKAVHYAQLIHHHYEQLLICGGLKKSSRIVIIFDYAAALERCSVERIRSKTRNTTSAVRFAC